MRLKWSRSKSSSDKRLAVPVGARAARSASARKYLRLARPVSESSYATRSSSRSATFQRVTSKCAPTTTG